MFTHLRSLFLFFTVAWMPLSADVVEIQNFSQIADFLHPNTLLVLDIDDTLLIPAQMLGCDEWFGGRMKELRDSGMSGVESLDRCLGDWEAVRHITKMEIVEPDTDKFIAEWQESGHIIMGMTTQGLALADRTTKQLYSHGINLGLTAPHSNDLYVLVGDHGTLFRRGVFFTSGTHKGQALFAFCDAAGIEPKHIVYVNDKGSYLYTVEEMALERGIAYDGLRYAYSDAKKEAFEYGVADYQFRHSSFAHILSDSEAHAQMRCP